MAKHKSSMKYALTVSTLLALLSVSSLAYAGCDVDYWNGDMPIIQKQSMKQYASAECMQAYAIGYSGVTRTPLWSAEHLTRDNLYAAKRMRRKNSFHANESIPSGQRAELSDFARSGYDRGHMSPSGDMPNADAQYESFALSNMIPQNPNNNRNLWEGIESATRTLAIDHGDLYVITGPLFIGDRLKRLHGHVLVPTMIYKAIYDPSTKTGAAYLVNNEAGMSYKVVTLAQIESMAGMTLFPSLSSRVKAAGMDLPKPTPHGFHDSGEGGYHQHEYGHPYEKAAEHLFKGLFR